MRFLVFISVFVLLSACSKQKQFEKKVHGTWNLKKQINVTGTEETKNDIYVFQEGSSTNGLPLFIYGSDTTEISYSVNKKATEVKFTNPVSGALIENWVIDFIDKDMLVLKTGYAFLVFER